ncbi:MAG: SpoIID/LytB domain-containing protein [Brevinematales bacterium]|nr:SpoIID/LytB domain-containing protein [Brevinematales bacterium]
MPLLKSILPLAAVLLLANCSYFGKPVYKASPVVRIFLSEGKEFTILPYKNYLLTIDTRKEVAAGDIHVGYSPKGIELNGTLYPVMTLELMPSQYFLLDGNAYRGTVRITNTGASLWVMNIIDIESYLYGVVASEVPAEWNIEALKAQAVAARTYALYDIMQARQSGQAFDVYADTRSQVYNGISAENKFAIAAVELTHGEVIEFDGKIIQAFFHACSGGMTEDCAFVFGNQKSYLTSVASPYAQKVYQNFTWECNIPVKELNSKLGSKLGTIVSVNVLTRTPSKRIDTIEIVDDQGNTLVMKGNDFRLLVGASLMKSTRANIKLENGVLNISGVGYGHGVGMGQWDAYGMAVSGFKYPDILKFFYKGTVIEKIW